MTNTALNPYVGPRAFTGDDPLFGRDRDLTNLTNLLIARRLVVLYAPSGAGKTSLIQAGLVPRLQRTRYRFLVYPVVRLARPSLLPALPSERRFVFSTLAALDLGLQARAPMAVEQLAQLDLPLYLDRLAAGVVRDEVLIFDQFEELFTVDPADEEARVTFFRQLGAALENPRRWALFAIREDYLGRLKPYTHLIPTRLDATYRLDLLDLTGAREAIQRPAGLMGVSFSDRAAAKLADDLSQVNVQGRNSEVIRRSGGQVEPVQLQVVCYRIWEEWARAGDPSATIDEEQIGEAGGVDEALRAYYGDCLRSAVRASGDSERQLRDWIETRLITSDGIRAQATRSAEAKGEVSDVALDILINRHLVRRERSRGADWFELAHDRLVEPIRTANRTWRDANLSLLQRQARVWEQGQRRPELLLRGAALDEAERWALMNQIRLLSLDRDLLTASLAARNTELREQQRSRWLRNLALATIVTLTLATVLLGLLLVAQAEAQRERQNALSQRETAIAAREQAAQDRGDARENLARLLLAQATNTDSDLRILLTLEAANRMQTAEVEQALYACLPLRSERILARGAPASRVVVSPGGRYVLVIEAEGEQGRLVPTTDEGRQRLLAQHQRPVVAGAFNPSGTRVATAAADGQILIADPASGRLVGEFTQDEPLAALAYLGDDTLVTAGTDGVLRVLNSASGTVLDELPLGRSALTSVAVSPDRRWAMVTQEDGESQLVNIERRERATGLRGETSAAISPDGTLALTVSEGRVLVWELDSRQLRLELTAGEQTLTAAAFSPDGQFVAGVGKGSVMLWDVAGGNVVRQYNVGSPPLTSVGFALGRESLALVGSDGVVRLWNFGLLPIVVSNGTAQVAASADGRIAVIDTRGRLLFGVIAPFAGWSPLPARDPVSLAFAPGGGQLLVGTATGTVEVWEPGGQQPVERRPVSDRPLPLVVVSPDGQTIAAASDDGIIWLLERNGNAPARALKGHTAAVQSLEFSADSRLLLSTGGDEVIRAWVVATATVARQFTWPSEGMLQARWSPDQRHILVIDGSPMATILDAMSGQELVTLAAPRTPDTRPRLISAAFVANGTRVLTAGFDDEIRLWNLSGDQPSQFLIEDNQQARQVLALADGTAFVSVDSQGWLTLRPASPTTLQATVGASVTRSLTRDERQRYLGEP